MGCAAGGGPRRQGLNAVRRIAEGQGSAAVYRGREGRLSARFTCGRARRLAFHALLRNPPHPAVVLLLVCRVQLREGGGGAEGHSLAHGTAWAVYEHERKH